MATSETQVTRPGGAIQALQWQRFVDLAAQEARSVPAKALIQSLLNENRWARDVPSARHLQQETRDINPLLDRDGIWGPLTDLADPAEALERLERGAVLEIADLALLRAWLYAVDSWVQIPRDEINGELFRKALSNLPDPMQPLRVLDRVLTPQGELSERASPKLASLHTEIRSLRREISATLDHLLKTFSQKGVLQEAFSDVRDGRYVIPVKISAQNEIDGIIYEASASRQTVFVEPKEVAPLNNRLRQRQNELIQEIYEVLKDTSARLRPYCGEIQTASFLVTHWDAVQARARFGRHYGGKVVDVTEERVFRLHQTTHPLLFWALPHEKIIRNEVDFGDPVRTLLITGPNTGGKTVLLKTLGLAALCARTGFPFPATEQPRVPFFNSVFADLGDPQSIEEHLSSFSGHVLRFKEILEKMTDRSLVLIDELNTATDPEEGAALGRAVLETVMERGAIVVTTTHDPHLKASAVSDARILNASMEFNESSRAPTYRIVLGVPGRSRALETAERLGIPATVLERARGYLSRGHQEFEKMLSRLEADAAEAAHARKEAVRLKDEAERLKNEWLEKTEKSVGDMMDRSRARLRRILEQAQDEARASIQKIDELRSRKEIDKLRDLLARSMSDATSRLESAVKDEAPELVHELEKHSKAKPAAVETDTGKPKLEAGLQVRVPKWKSIGKIVEVSGDRIKVALGTLQVTLGPDDVEHLTAAEERALPKPKAKVQSGPADPGREIDLRGIRLEEAMMELERYLDLAFRSGLYAEVNVIHGLGTGAIREGARKLLKRLPYVKQFRDGGIGAGGSGATLVEFDRD